MLFAQAAELWREMRADYELVKEAAYERAENACNGVLLNARGERAGVDAYSLFSGPRIRAEAYASEELLEHWQTHPRVTVTAYERQWLASTPTPAR